MNKPLDEMDYNELIGELLTLVGIKVSFKNL